MVTLEDIQKVEAQIKDASWGYGPREIRMNKKTAERLTEEYGDLAGVFAAKITVVEIKQVVMIDIAGQLHVVKAA